MTHLMSSIGILEKLISFPTISKDSNLELIFFIAEYLENFGIQSDIYYNAEKTKANLFASIGNVEKPGVILSGHTDVVPVEGQIWDSDPFKLTAKNERFYGRGTCDMKGFIAVALSLLPTMTKNNLSRPIHFAFSYDEEIGCVGVHSMLDSMKHKDIAGSIVIVGEPTSMRPVAAHKGKSTYRCNLSGKACHSSMSPKAINTIELAAEIILHIKNLMDEARNNPIKTGLFEFPYITSNVGVINGGTAVNVVPQNCTFDVEFRYPPGLDATLEINSVRNFIIKEILSKIKARYPKGSAEWYQLNSYPSFSAENDRNALEMAKMITNCNEELGVNYGTEAGLFSRAGFSSVICGPGSIEQAHQANEFVELKQIVLCEEFINTIIKNCVND